MIFQERLPFRQSPLQHIHRKILTLRRLAFLNMRKLIGSLVIAIIAGALGIGAWIFFKDKEKLYSLSVLHGELFKDSYMYVHFLRRRIKIGIKSNALNYLIVPNKIIPMLDSFDKSSITSYSRNNMLKYWIELAIAKRKKMTIRNIIHYFLERYKATRK